ncbi:MAG TPA: fumarylacetoacetate hydrolase family protein [Acidimicrobiia bacterium]
MTSPTEIADSLYEARRLRKPVPPLTESAPGLSAAEAYAIQQALVGRFEEDGASRVGWKLGLTSKPMQQMFGVDQPDYAPVLSSMVFDDGAVVDLDTLIQPRVEAEIALVLDRDLRGPGLTLAQVAESVSGAIAAIEIVDSRIMDWKIKLADTIADLASSGATVLGSAAVTLDFDPRLCGMVISKNGETMATGAGAAALGSPVAAVAWLANTLAPFDVTLEAGEFVMTGSLHAAFPVSQGDLVEAEFDRLGRVGVRFEGGSG